MTTEEAQELVRRWPDDLSVPEKLAAAIKQAKGQAKQELSLLVEALQLQAITPVEIGLMMEHFG
jgi:hypothetical protein